MRVTQARGMTQVCTVTRNPAVGETAVSIVAVDLRCSPPLPLDSVQKWGADVAMATDIDYMEMMTADNADVQRFDVLDVDGKTFTVQKVRRYPQRGFALGFLSLLLGARI